MTLKERFAAKKAAKHARQVKAGINVLERRAKRDRNHGLNDHIPQYEWHTSSYAMYFNQLRSAVADNKLTIDDILNQLTQLHRMTFFPCEYDFNNIRLIIENVFTKYVSDLTLDQAHAVRGTPINIHYKQRELLSKFIDVIGAIIPTYKSRKKFAEDNADMILTHELYCKIGDNVVTRFSDWEGVALAKQTIQDRIDSKERYLENKQEIAKLKTIV